MLQLELELEQYIDEISNRRLMQDGEVEGWRMED